MRKIRVLVIDDSAYNRRTISRLLAELPEVQVVGFARNGVEGLRQALELKPDLITLDLEMPTMEGFTFLRLLMGRCPVPVIVVSSRGDGNRVIQALELGAVDCVLKPGGPHAPNPEEMGDDLRRTVREFFALKQPEPRVDEVGEPIATVSEPLPHREPGPAIQAVVIGASTGGPAALKKMLMSFSDPPPLAFLVAQHMPECFTRAFAERLDRITPFRVREAADGDEVLPGRVLVAPGGRHLSLDHREGRVVVKLLDPEPGNRYLPSADVLFRSAARLYGPRLLGVILTGMGNDGTAGARSIREMGGQVIAESAETAVVFGMPGEAIAAGAVDRVVPLDEIAAEILRGASVS